jgi:3D (Asp-Asp-Asp) domain-containing protein
MKAGLIIWVVVVTVISILLGSVINELREHGQNRKQELQEIQLTQQKIFSTIENIRLHNKSAFKVTVTAYSSEENQTDSTPYTTAFMTRVRPGMIAVSWSLLAEGWTPGRCAWIDTVGVREIDDIMDRDWPDERIDIYFHATTDAEAYGIKRNVQAVLMVTCGDKK